MNGPADFFRTMLPYAQRVSELTGVDPRLVLAQSALETGYGRSAPGQNFFGIKAPAGQGQGLMTMEFEGGQMVPRREAFRTYDDPSQSFQDYANLLLRNDRYAPVREARTLEDQIRAMGASGYATDPEYANKLRSIAYGIDLNAPELIASDAMSALGRGADTSGMMATTEARPAMNGRQMTPGLLAQDAAATAQPMPARQATDYGNLLDALAIGFSGMTLRPNEGLVQLAQQRIKGRREQAQRNATADWLESQGMTQYADAVRQGTIGGAEALKLARGGEATAAQRNYEFLIGQGVDPETAMQQAFGGGGTTINMPGQMERVGDQVLIADPNSPAGVRLVDIPGGKASAEAQAEVERAARAAEQRGVQRSVVADSVDYLVGQLDKSGKRLFDLPEAGIVGGALAGMGINQEAVDFRNQLRSLQATIAFDTLAQMREASKTGGALGAVSERELDLLMNALGNIDQTTSPDLLRRNLNTIKDIMTKIENDPVARGFYYGNAQGAGGQAQPQTSIGGVTVGEPY